MSPIAAFLDGKIPEEELFLQVEQAFASGSEADRTALLVDWRTKSGRIRRLSTRRTLDETVMRVSGALQGDMARTLSGGPIGRMSEAAPGQTLCGRFVLEDKIGSGGMSDVYRCRDLRREEAQDRNPYIALKLLRPSVMEREDSIKILQREARKAQSLAHPNIVRVYDFDREGDILFITMELLNGDSLEDMIRANGRQGTTLAAIFPMLTQLVSALQFAHQEGIVHSDLKPSNVIVQSNGRVKIIDFGISRARPDLHQQTSDRTTFDIQALGAMTPAYASPEMIEGAAPDPRDDVFALACIIYELLAGRHPFGRTPATMAQAGNFRAPPPASLSQRQWEGLQAGLAFDRAHRAASPEDLLARLMVPAGRSRFGPRAILLGAGVLVALAGGLTAAYLRFPLLGGPAFLAGNVSGSHNASEDLARKQAEQQAAEAAARKQAEQQAAEAAARKQAEQQAAEAAARKQAEQQAAEAAARKQAEQQAAEAAARKQAEVQNQQQVGAVQVADAQTRLNAMGFDTGPVDGNLGPRTREMIRAFEFASGLPQDGNLTGNLLSRLQSKSPSSAIRAKALFQLAADAEAHQRNLDAIQLYRLGLKLAPTDAPATHRLTKLVQEQEHAGSVSQQRIPADSRTVNKVEAGEQGAGAGNNSRQDSGGASSVFHQAERQPQSSEPKAEGPFDGSYWGTFKPNWFSAPGCDEFQRPIWISENKAYIEYRSKVIVADVKPDGSFTGSEELDDINMTETISGKVSGKSVQASAQNRLCRYHGIFTKEN